MKKSAVISLALVPCLLLVGCMGMGPETFNGRYRSEDWAFQLEFYDDSTVELRRYDGVIGTGTYERVERNTYELRLTVISDQIRYTAVIDGDTIMLTNLSDESSVRTYYLTDESRWFDVESF